MSLGLTHSDTKKGDWLQKDGKPHIHYIENVFALTGRILFIFDYDRVMEDMPFEDIYELPPDEDIYDYPEYDYPENYSEYGLAIEGDLNIRCGHCHAENLISAGDLLENLELTSSHERNMGTERIFSITYNHQCHKCEYPLEIYIHIDEYPLGALDSEDISVMQNGKTGPEVIESPSFSFW
ncbi:MAG TPA: hypothetical protein VLL52_20810 [Anaerolineae bacterium]|nr:hypothetical protein [Anaerolineae bacterium]